MSPYKTVTHVPACTERPGGAEVGWMELEALYLKRSQSGVSVKGGDVVGVMGGACVAKSGASRVEQRG